MTIRYDIDHTIFDLKITNQAYMLYTYDKYNITVFATTRFDGCPQLGIYVTMVNSDGTLFRVQKDFDGLDYAMAWVIDQVKTSN